MEPITSIFGIVILQVVPLNAVTNKILNILKSNNLPNNQLKKEKQIFFILLFALTPVQHFAQHISKINAVVNLKDKTLEIKQELIFNNQTGDTLSTIILNDWNNAYSSVGTPLSQRFSDEFYVGFYTSKEEEHGSTYNIKIVNAQKGDLKWERTTENPDFIELQLDQKLPPNQTTTIYLNYTIKVPSDQFTKYGYNSTGQLNLKNWFLCPARYENHAFVRYNNLNLDDIANALGHYEIDLVVDKKSMVTSDLESEISEQNESTDTYKLTGKNRTDFNLFIQKFMNFQVFKKDSIEVATNLQMGKLDSIQKALIINKIVNFTNKSIGMYPHTKILVSQVDYDRNPLYGLNQLPSFLRPFTDEFLFEISFLKTYTNNYLKYSLNLDPRKDNWIYDGIQIYTMIKYIEEYHPDSKMTGNLYKHWYLRGFHLVDLDFNQQYHNAYLLMARKNLDQPLKYPKDKLIKFNQQMSNKYFSGINLNYLDSYLKNDYMKQCITQFYAMNWQRQLSQSDFERILRSNTTKNIDWFFDYINDRKLIDYKFSNISKTNDSISFKLKNRIGTKAPVPVYGIKNNDVVFKKWIDEEQIDSTYTVSRNDAEKIVINYKTEVPEYNERNNYKSLKSFALNRPFKFTLIKDLEDPRYNQILYSPVMPYNVYDGLSPGIRFHNKALLNKTFNYDLIPSYAIKSKTITGIYTVSLTQNLREKNPFQIKYSLASSYYHYAEDATYLKMNPMVQIYFRKPDYRDNMKKMLQIRQVIINRETPPIPVDLENAPEDYSVFNIKYVINKTEFDNHLNLTNDFQIGNDFSKVSTQIEYRKFLNNDRQIFLRGFAGVFLKNTSKTDYFSFATDRPTDYLFDYIYYGRSEDTGFFSQQFIMAEGGFKSKLTPAYANQWITTVNATATIWNWIEAYGDVGLVKNKNSKAEFLYDSGIRFNLLTDYYEVFFPIYSNNGWEIAQSHYGEKIRFVITLDFNKLFVLFSRKWF